MPTRGTNSSRDSSSFAIPRKHRVSLIGKFRIALIMLPQLTIRMALSMSECLLRSPILTSSLLDRTASTCRTSIQPTAKAV
jgi:hypothetical protein